MNPRTVYLDNNATTRLAPEARAAMEPFLADCYGNPSSPYAFARPASRALARAREQVAALVGVEPTRLVFTAGGTESNNLALHAALTARPERRHLILSAVEHASVLQAARAWEKRGVRLSVIPVSPAGELDLAAYRQALDKDTALVSLMTANNETGVCFPVEECGALAHRVGAWFHTDAVQAAGKLAPAEWAADFISLCAHKLHGPKGAGALVVPGVLEAVPLLAGGEQEFGWRAGTENVAALAGFGAAAEVAAATRSDFMPRLRAWHDHVEQELTRRLPGSRILGAGTPRLPNTTLLQVDGVDTESVLARLDLAGFCCSSGSACAAGAHQPSHVLQAMGGAGKGAVVRLSSSRFTTASELESLVDTLVLSVHELRQVTRS